MNILRLIVLGIFGYIGIQYLFFVTVNLANAPLATILQFTAPVFVYLYMLLRGRKELRLFEIAMVVLTFVGVILMVTKGDITSIEISPLGLITGLGSGIALSITSIQPKKMIEEHNSPIVTGWAMFFGGVLFQFITPVWQPGFELDAKSTIYTIIIVFFGTTLAFLAYMASSKFVDASIASIMTVLEPLGATFLAVVFLGQVFTFIEGVGIVIILASVIGLSAFNGYMRKKQTQLYEKE